MPNQDPLAILVSQMTSGLAGMDKSLIAVFNVLDQMAPHNVLANLTKGGGTFSAVMGTKELVSKNIFGG